MDYRRALEIQWETHQAVLDARDHNDAPIGTALLVEHDPPVITISRRRGADAHLLAGETQLAKEGIEVQETDRGGDITYHGPGQLVVYPIVDLNRLGLGLHAYMRALEEAIIHTCAEFGIAAGREAGLTGVWLAPDESRALPLRKIAALGVRVRKWVTMHGLALNVTTDLDHFSMIVPCGLPDKAVTSMAHELAGACPPPMQLVRQSITRHLAHELGAEVVAG